MTQNLDQINYIIARFLINVENVDYRHKRFLETDLTYKTGRIIIDCMFYVILRLSYTWVKHSNLSWIWRVFVYILMSKKQMKNVTKVLWKLLSFIFIIFIFIIFILVWMPNSARIRHKKVNLVFIINMVEIELNAGSKGSKMSDVIFFVLSSNKPTIFFINRINLNFGAEGFCFSEWKKYISKSSQNKLEKGCPN